jgi:2-polyprenyl-3-methyl-5-hydroxy-6-metoxy-1,4-benzoquinol methylase
MEAFRYSGELELFELAVNWKRYWQRHVRRYLGRRVLENGAGIATNTPQLVSDACEDWLCLDPDVRQVDIMRRAMLPQNCRVACGTIMDLVAAANEKFDTILYIDVLEHIEDDCAEVAAARNLLLPGGHLVVLAPAHQFLYSPFDAEVGHYRRYDRRSLAACAAHGLVPVEMRYLDSVGLVASAANRFLLKAGTATSAQIKLWDRAMVPLSRCIDPLVHGLIGKSIFAVWRRSDP